MQRLVNGGLFGGFSLLFGLSRTVFETVAIIAGSYDMTVMREAVE